MENVKQEYEKFLNSRGVEYKNTLTLEEIKNLVAEVIQKEAQTS